MNGVSRCIITFVALAAMTSSTACTERAERGVSDTSASARTDDSTLAVMSGTWAEGDEQSEWKVDRVPDGFIISEQATFGGDARAVRTFEFSPSQRLRRVIERRTQTMSYGDRSPESVTSELMIDFTQSPEVARKTVTRAPKPVQPYEIENLRAHAEVLRSLTHLPIAANGSRSTITQHNADTTHR